MGVDPAALAVAAPVVLSPALLVVPGEPHPTARDTTSTKPAAGWWVHASARIKAT